MPTRLPRDQPHPHRLRALERHLGLCGKLRGHCAGGLLPWHQLLRGAFTDRMHEGGRMFPDRAGRVLLRHAIAGLQRRHLQYRLQSALRGHSGGRALPAREHSAEPLANLSATGVLAAERLPRSAPDPCWLREDFLWLALRRGMDRHSPRGLRPGRLLRPAAAHPHRLSEDRTLQNAGRGHVHLRLLRLRRGFCGDGHGVHNPLQAALQRHCVAGLLP